MKKKRPGFQLVELLLVVGLIGVMLGLIIPAIQRARDAAMRAECGSRMRQIGVALHQYHLHLDHFPPPKSYNHGDHERTSGKGMTLSWQVWILPHLEQATLYTEALAAAQIEAGGWLNPPHRGMEVVVPVYVCPADSRLRTPLTDPHGIRASFTSYVGIAGDLPDGRRVIEPGVFEWRSREGTRLEEIRDGAGNTIMVGERPPPASLQAGWWYPGNVVGDSVNFRGPNTSMYMRFGAFLIFDPCHGARRISFGPGVIENPCDRYHLWSLHEGGANFLFADGTVRFLPYAAESIVPALATRSGGEGPAAWPE